MKRQNIIYEERIQYNKELEVEINKDNEVKEINKKLEEIDLDLEKLKLARSLLLKAKKTSLTNLSRIYRKNNPFSKAKELKNLQNKYNKNA